jgi:hypothetical protein
MGINRVLKSVDKAAMVIFVTVHDLTSWLGN